MPIAGYLPKNLASSTSFGRDKGGKVKAAGWQVTLCDPIWHVISRSGVMITTNCYIRFTFTSTRQATNTVVCSAGTKIYVLWSMFCAMSILIKVCCLLVCQLSTTLYKCQLHMTAHSTSDDRMQRSFLCCHALHVACCTFQPCQLCAIRAWLFVCRPNNYQH